LEKFTSECILPLLTPLSPTRSGTRTSDPLLPMIAFEVKKNGQLVCVAGAEDMGVLSTIISAGGKLGNKSALARPDATTPEIHYSVGGLTRRPDSDKDVFVDWLSISPLEVGDVIEVRIIETDQADRAKSRKRANLNRTPSP
jgi:hypothetical protein